MRRSATRGRRAIVALVLGLNALGCATLPDLENPRSFETEDLSFRYPGNWTVREETETDGAVTYRAVGGKSPDYASFAVMSYTPPIDLTLEEYAAELHATLLEGASQIGRMKTEAMTFGPTRAQIGGLPHDGVQIVYSVVLSGQRVPFKVEVFELVREFATVFVLVKAPLDRWHRVAPGFELVLDSLEIQPRP